MMREGEGGMMSDTQALDTIARLPLLAKYAPQVAQLVRATGRTLSHGGNVYDLPPAQPQVQSTEPELRVLSWRHR